MARAKTKYSVLRVAESDGLSLAAVLILNRNLDAIKAQLDTVDTSPIGIKAIIAGTSSTTDLTGSKIRFLDTVASLLTAGVTWTGVKTGSDDEPDTMRATITALGGGPPVGGSGVPTRVAFWGATTTLDSSDNLYWTQFASPTIPGGELRITYDEAALIDGGTAVQVPLVLRTETSSTPGAGFGTGILFQAENAAGTMEDLGRLDYLWSDPAASSEDSGARVLLRAAGGGLTEVARFTGTKRLGIGTATPLRTLDLFDNTPGGVIAYIQNASAADGAFSEWIMQTTAGAAGQYLYTSATTGDYVDGVPNAGLFVSQYSSTVTGHILATTGTGPMYWSMDGSRQMTLTFDGHLALLADADTNAAAEVLSVGRKRYSTTPPGAAGFGAYIAYRLEGFTNDSSVDAARILGAWEVAQTNDTTARDSFLSFSTMLDNALSEVARLSSLGYFGVGTVAADIGILAAGTTQAAASVGSQRASGTPGSGPFAELRRSRGTVASPTALSDADALGTLDFKGYTDAFKSAARIYALAGTGWGASGNDAPGTLFFATSADGSATPTDHLKLTQNGLLSLVAAGDGFEMLGSSPALGVSTAGSWRTRNNAGAAEISWNNHPWQDFTTDHVGFGAKVNTHTGTRWLVAWGRAEAYLQDDGTGLAPRTAAGERIMGWTEALRAGVIRGLRVRVEQAPVSGGDYVFEIVKNGAPGTLTGVKVTLTGANASGSDTTNVSEVSIGQSLAVRITFTGAPANNPGQVYAEFIY